MHTIPPSRYPQKKTLKTLCICKHTKKVHSGIAGNCLSGTDRGWCPCKEYKEKRTREKIIGDALKHNPGVSKEAAISILRAKGLIK